MSGDQHTPGPWKVYRSPDGSAIIGIGVNRPGDPDHGAGITDPRFGLWGSGAEREANARLIAAAPDTAAERDRLKAVNADLLSALKLFRTKVYNAALCSGMDHEWATEACSLADAAIAKAEGGAE